MAFNIETLLGVDTLQLIKPTIKYLIKKHRYKLLFLESSFLGEGECKDVELFRTDETPHEIASGVNFQQLELLIQA